MNPTSTALRPDYLSIEQNLRFIKEPCRSACLCLWHKYRKLFTNAPGATCNHQAWPGGYADHVCEVLNYARHLYQFDVTFGRPIGFELHDAMLVLFLHDIEKPFRLKWQADGAIANVPALASKSASCAFRERLIKEAGILLTPPQQVALKYVEGEGADYSRERRAMNELAAFCHKADVWSSRQCYNYPKARNDEWTGALRHHGVEP